jgi:hypothetical protein
MTMRWPAILVAAALLAAGPARAAATRNELLFSLLAALKTHDKAAVARCFNLAGVDDAGRRALNEILNQLLAWPSCHVFTSERSERGKAIIPQEGKNYTLNGDWTFQIHIHVKEPPSRGFVFPAGQADGRCQILLMVKDKP